MPFTSELFWTQTFLTFLISFGIAMLLTPAVIAVASRYSWLDRPGHRKIHVHPMPRLGGVAIYLGTWVSWGVFIVLNPNFLPYEYVQPFWGLFWASTLIWCLGLYDDLRGTNAYQKLAVQVVAAGIVIWKGFGIRLINNPFAGGDLLVGHEWAVWGVTIFWIVFVTNSINLIDGLDGLAGGVCFITAMTLHFIAKDLGSPHLPYFALSIAGACLGFLFFNFSPARIFLGDSGSLFLGFILACLSIMGTTKRSTAIVMYGPPLILALPVADTLFAVARRFLRKVQTGEIQTADRKAVLWNLFYRLRQVFHADQEHIHHGLLKIGLSHRRAVILLYFVTAILGLTAYRTAVYDYLRSTAAIFLLLSLLLFWLRYKVSKE